MEGNLPNDLRYFHWSFPTIEGRSPVEVELALARLQYPSGDEYGLRVEVAGLIHPYDAEGRYNIGGEVDQNPALLPAANALKQSIRDSLAQKLQALGLSIVPDTTSAEWITGKDNYSMVLCLNPTEGVRASRGIRRVEETQLVALADTVKKDIDEMVSQIQKLIDDNRHLQPEADPDAKTKATFNNKVGGAWASAVRGLENKGIGRARGGSITPKIEDN